MPSKRPIRLSVDLAMPLDAITQTLGIFGIKGSGKSSTSAVFVEQGVEAGGRFVIADPTGVWWGLMHDGTGPGLPGIVFGGEHGDVPLERTAGHVVAEFVMQQDEYPVVVLDLKLMRKAERTSFMLAFMETLYHDNREALHVVLDEAWQFAPMKPMEGGDQIKLLGAVEDVVALGRSRGLGITMISQRFATLNANVREQIGTLIVHQLVGALDRKALRGWIEAQADPAREKEVLEVQAKLKVAQALVWSPAFLPFFGVVHIDAPTTFDSRATPKVGQRVKKPGKRAAVNLNVLREKMAATIAESEANDPKLLKQRLVKAERTISDQAIEIIELERRPAEAQEAVRVEVPVLTDEERGMLGHLAKAIDGLAEQGKVIADVAAELGAKIEARAEPVAVPDRKMTDRVRTPLAAPRPIEPPRKPADARQSVLPARERAAANGGVPAPQQKILDALGWYEALGVTAATRVQIAMIAGYSHTSGGYQNLISKLRTSGLVEYLTAGTVALTPEGRALATDPGLPTTNDGVQAAILARLPSPQAKILTELIRAYPGSLSREEIANRTGYSATSGGFQNLISKLRTAALVDYPDRGSAVALDVLFPMG